MNITRRSLLTTTAALALGASLPAAETHAVVTLKLTWTGGERTQIDYVTVPAYPAPVCGVSEFGQGVRCRVEVTRGGV